MGAARASIDPKNTCIPLRKRIGSIISDCSKEDPASTCHGPDICNTRDQRKSSPKRENIDRVSFTVFLRFFECTLKDTLTAKNGDVSSLTP